MLHRLAVLVAACYVSAAGADSTVFREPPDSPLALKLSRTLGMALPDADSPDEKDEKDGSNQPVIYAVTINGEEQQDEVSALRLSTVELTVPEETISRWRFRMPLAAPLEIDGKRFLNMAMLQGVRWRVDERTQTLIIDADASAYESSILAQPVLPASFPATITAGGFLNYDLQHDRSNGTYSSAGLFETGLFTRWGNGSTTSLMLDAGSLKRQVRLDSQWDLPMPDRKQNIRLGDTVGYAGSWGRSTRFGGLQWGTKFSLAPGFVPFPMPTLRGEAVIPSTVDLFVNDAYRMQGQVRAGPFEMPNVPLVTGQGEIKMIVRDALGRQQVTVQPYYASRNLLAPGLHEFSYEIGKVREDYGTVSNRYGRAFATATHRIGISSAFTAELRAELLKSQQTAGAGMQWVAPRLGTAAVRGAVSRNSGLPGAMIGAGVDRQTAGLSANLNASYYSRHFTQLGRSSSQPTRHEIAAGLGLPWGGGGIGVAFVNQSTWSRERRQTLSANFTRHLGRYGYLMFAVARDKGASNGSVANLVWAYAIDGATTASVGMTRDPGGKQFVAQVERGIADATGLGYQLNMDQGQRDRMSAMATWQTAHMKMTGGLARQQRETAARLGITGGVAIVGSDIYLSRRINDSFAVVDVDGYPDINVLVENRLVGRTDRHGKAFIDNLLPYERNRITIDQSALPFDARIDQMEITVAPPARSGVSVRFPVRRHKSVTARLMLGKEQPIPAGSVVKTANGEQRFTVGFEGVVYLTDLPQSDRITLDWNGVRCELQLSGKASVEAEDSSVETVMCRRGST